jgi:hypothetical protein
MADELACYHGCALFSKFQSCFKIRKDVVVVVKDLKKIIEKTHQVLSKTCKIDV